jgi:hypothetical protein
MSLSSAELNENAFDHHLANLPSPKAAMAEDLIFLNL